MFPFFQGCDNSSFKMIYKMFIYLQTQECQSAMKQETTMSTCYRDV